MKKWIGAALVLAAIAMAAVLQDQISAKPPEDKPAVSGPHTVKVHMRKKLELAQQALEGLVTEDFSLIQRSAKRLNDISRKTGWDVIEAPEYEHLSAEFRRLAISLEQAAERKNLDGATLAYLRLTSNCIECHKFTRGFRLSGAR